MNFLFPILLDIREDELVFSWVSRLRDVNLFSKGSFFRETFLGGEHIRPDGFSYLVPLVRSAGGYRSLYELALFQTMYPLQAASISWSQQETLLQVISQGHANTLLTSPHHFFREIRVCPLCMEADRESSLGMSVYRSHQAPGVDVCHIHGCRLETAEVSREGQVMFPEETRVSWPDDELRQAYAEFVHGFLTSGAAARNDLCQNAFRSFFREKGLTRARDIKEFLEGSGLRSFLPEPSKIDIRGLHAAGHPVAVGTMLPALFCSFGSADNLSRYLAKETPDRKREVCSSLHEQGFSLTSPFREDILSVRCGACGWEQLITPDGVLSGIRCPACSPETGAEMFRRLFGHAAGSSYTLVSGFKAMKKDITVCHEDCGKEYSVRPGDFLFKGSRCSCGQKVSFRDAEKRMPPGFRLASYNGPNGVALIEHTEKSHCFTARLSFFLTDPWCRACSPDRTKMKNLPSGEKQRFFKDEVEAVVGGEYTVTGKFTTRNGSVAIRHNVCGKERTYTAARFTAGCRCPECSAVVSLPELKAYTMDVTNGEYEVLENDGGKLSLLRNTLTGETRWIGIARLLQELSRPTPSSEVPVKNRTRKPFLGKRGRLFVRIMDLFPPGQEFRVCDVSRGEKGTFNMLRRMARAGLLHEVSNSSYTADEEHVRRYRKLMTYYQKEAGNGKKSI